MFESLDDQMEHDDAAVTSKKEKVIRYITIVVVSLLVFGGLYYGVSMLG
jgi:hypothetical protein